MQEIKKICICKKLGQTPLERLTEWKRENNYPFKLTYAGRLDPMAEGALLLLGRDRFEKEKYLNLDKQYEFEILFGVSTDSLDLAGLIDFEKDCENIDLNFFKKNLKKFKGKIKLYYPKFSSKKVDGKPLFQKALEEKINYLPEKVVNIYSIKLLEIKKKSAEQLKEEVLSRIDTLPSSTKFLSNNAFRKNEVRKSWMLFFDKNKDRYFTIAKFKTDVSSGTYIRVLAKEIAEEIGCPGVVFSLKRTKIGKYRFFGIYSPLYCKCKINCLS